MKIEILVPNGFCYGVITAYNIAMKTINENPDKNIYMLGWLVHNEKVINEFIEKGIKVIDDKNIDRYDLVNNLPYDKNGILIFSAHGTSEDVIELAKNKGYKIIDLTCKYVYKTHHVIKQKMNENKNIIFIGKKHHPETNAILKNFKDVILIENIDDIKKIKFDNQKEYFCTNQTTISQYQFNDIINKLVKINKNIEFQNDICDATKIRQDAVINMSSEIDICIIVGDKKSSNTNELYKLANNKVESYKINDINEINFNWFNNKKCCAITAGASTPRNLINDVINVIDKKINGGNNGN